MWLLTTWNMASVIEKLILKFLFDFILIYLTFSSFMWLAAIVSDSPAPE